MNKKISEKETYNIQTSNGVLIVQVGKDYKGIGCCGMSDGVQVTGKVTTYNQSQNIITLEDEKGMPHSVIPSTLCEI